MEYAYGKISKFNIQEGKTIAYNMSDLQNSVVDKIDIEINKVQKRVSRLDRFNRKSRWINASRHK